MRTRAIWGKQKYARHPRHPRQAIVVRGDGDAMTTIELLALRSVLTLRRGALLDRLATDQSGAIEPGFLRLLADTHTAITAVDAQLIELEGGE